MLLRRLSIWIAGAFGYSPDEQLKMINQNSGRLLTYAEGAVKQLASSLTGWFIFFELLPVCIFFILLYRTLFVKFMKKSVNQRGRAEEDKVIRSYSATSSACSSSSAISFVGGALAGISGMFLAMLLVAVMKILFDHSPGYKNWGILLGDDRS